MAVTLLALLFAAAVLYTAAGQAGASGYLAVMALHGLDPATMRPTALTLNILVGSYATWRMGRAGWLDPRVLWGWLVGSVPLSFIGGLTVLPNAWYRGLLGGLLVLIGLRVWWDAGRARTGVPSGTPPRVVQWVGGAAIGLVSGLTGVGGGVLLGPLLLTMRWADPRRAAGLTTPFILVNSTAALAGAAMTMPALPAALPAYAAATLAGAVIGGHLAISRFSPATLQRMMAVVLLLGGVAALLPR